LDKHYFIEYQENNIVKITRRESGKFNMLICQTRVINLIKQTDDQVFDLTLKIPRCTTGIPAEEFIPVSSIYGYPLVIGDFNHNGKTDFAGSYINGQV